MVLHEMSPILFRHTGTPRAFLHPGNNAIAAGAFNDSIEIGAGASLPGRTFAQLISIVQNIFSEPPLTAGSAGIPDITSRIFKKETSLCSIDAEFPWVSGCALESAERMCNHAIGELVGEKISDFKASAYSNPPSDGMSNAIDLGFSVALRNEKLLSITISDCQFLAGTAHPSHDINTLNFDLEGVRRIELFDLFTMEKDDIEIHDLFKDHHKDYLERGFPILQRLSDYCINDLKINGIESSWMDDGAGPFERNFVNFNLAEKSLIINFNEYQVASYAEGPQMVEIPYDVLADLLDPEGPLGDFARPAPDFPPEHVDPPMVEDELGMIIIDGLKLEKR